MSRFRNGSGLLNRLLGTKTGKAMEAELLAEIEDGRQGNVDGMTRLRAEAAETQPALDKAAAEAKVKLLNLAKAHGEAKAHAAATARIADGARFSLHHRISALEGQLRITADPEIDILIGSLDGLWESTRRISPDVVEYGEKSWPQGQRNRVSNRESIVAKMDSIRTAIREAEALKIETGVDVEARLAEIREGIPGIEDPEKFIPSPSELLPEPVPEPDVAKVLGSRYYADKSS